MRKTFAVIAALTALTVSAGCSSWMHDKGKTPPPVDSALEGSSASSSLASSSSDVQL